MDEKNSKAELLLQKQTRLLRVQVLLGIVVLLITAVGCFFVVRESLQLNRCLGLAEEKLAALDMDALNAAVKNVGDTAEELRSIDSDTINRASSAIQSAADGIRGLDLEKLDSIMQGMDSAAGKLDSAVNALKSIFK